MISNLVANYNWPIFCVTYAVCYDLIDNRIEIYELRKSLLNAFMVDLGFYNRMLALLG